MARSPNTNKPAPAKPGADFSKEHSAVIGADAATAAVIGNAADAAGAQAPATNATPSATEGSRPAPSGPAGTAAPEGERKPETIDLAWPLPAGFPDAALAGAKLVVKAKPKNGRWRARRHFTRGETLIPLAELKPGEADTIAADPQLAVMVRLVKPD